VHAIADVCTRLEARFGIDDVVLTGGCFVNALLTEMTLAALTRAGLSAHTHRLVPPNDGGLAYGQLAAVAAHDGGVAPCA
jgi:hydrogenase maturation protein HypF